MGAAGIVFFLTEANRGIGIAFVVIGVVFVGTSFAIARKARSDARADDQVPPKPPAAEAPPAEASTPEPPAPR